MTSFVSTTDAGRQMLSTLLGALVCFLLLELAERVRGKDRTLARLWWGCGAFVAGTGLWAAHLLATGPLPGSPGHAAPSTTLAWLCAVAAAGIALSVARRDPRAARSLLGAVAIAAALCAMHIASVAAIEVAPAAEWNLARVAATAVLAIAFAAALLAAFDRDRRHHGAAAIVVRIVAVAVLGALLAALDVGSASAFHLAASAVVVAGGIADAPLVEVVTMTVPLVVVCAALSSIGYGLVDQRRNALAGSLEHVAARLHTATDELRQRAMLDPLTGLPNRLLFEDRLAQALLRADRAKMSVRGLREKLAVLFVDVDSLKPINDTFGHAAGDEVIRQIARRLRHEARDDDTVSRIGADQFLLLMEGAVTGNDCVALATRILEAVKQPMTIVDRRFEVSVSIGIVVYPDHGERTKLLAQADAAMQAAKRAGRGTYALFESHMHRDIADQLDLINDLRHAVDLEPARAALPAEDRRSPPRDLRRRGAAALGASGARPDQSGGSSSRSPNASG